MPTKPTLHLLLREPLLHFLLIGVVLFLVYTLLNDNRIDDGRVVISEAKINHLISLWKKKRLRPPTQAELDSMIQQQVREEIMVREALAMGLDKDDSVIRRRLAQKVEFISSDLATAIEPTETDLADYLRDNREQFEQPAQIDFIQVFVDPAKHGMNTEIYIKNLQDKLTQTDPGTDVSTIGDPIMLDQGYAQITEHGLSRLFGDAFAKAVFELPVGSWQGPVTSGYGYHLVHISERSEARLPELDAVREKVRSEWFTAQRDSFDEAFYEGLRQRYEVIIEKIPADVITANNK